MTTDAVTLWFALLAIVAQLAAVSILVLHLTGRRPVLAEHVGPNALWLAFAVALVATLGSLYLSEVAHFPPCKLCWYQRIAMYPLVVVLGVAAARRDLGARLAAGILAVLGGATSIYHLLVERYPSLSSSSSCDPANPCSIRWVERFGYLTIPGMALSGFALIVVLLAVAGAGRPAGERTDLAAS